MEKRMSKTSVKKNFMYQMVYEILILILPFITSPYIARTIGAEGLGIYSYSYSVANYFVLFSMLGLKNYGNRKIAQNRDDRKTLNDTFSNLVVLHICVSLLVSFVYIDYIVFIAENKIYALIQLLVVISSLFDISWFYFGIEKFKMIVTRNIIVKIVNIACVFIFVKRSEDLWIYCLIMALGMLISQVLLWIPLRNYVSFVKPKWKKIKEHIKPLLILFIPAIAISVYKYMDKIMIGSLSSKSQLGFYENAEKVVSIPLTIIASFGTVMLPKMSNLVSGGFKKETDRYISLSMKYVMCLAFALSFGLIGVGKVFAPIFWGKEFLLSGDIIMGLAITVPFVSFANVIRTQYLIPTEKDKEYLSSVIGGAIINFIINLMLIPSLGSIGATIGTIFAEISVCCIQVFVVRRDLPIWEYIKNSISFLIFGILMFGIVYITGILLGDSISTLFIQIGIGGCFYCVMCLIFFIKTKDKIIMNILNKIKRKLLKQDREF